MAVRVRFRCCGVGFDVSSLSKGRRCETSRSLLRVLAFYAVVFSRCSVGHHVKKQLARSSSPRAEVKSFVLHRPNLQSLRTLAHSHIRSALLRQSHLVDRCLAASWSSAVHSKVCLDSTKGAYSIRLCDQRARKGLSSADVGRCPSHSNATNNRVARRPHPYHAIVDDQHFTSFGRPKARTFSMGEFKQIDYK